MNQKIWLSVETLRRIARYEETFEKYVTGIPGFEGEYRARFDPEYGYSMSLEDLREGLRNILAFRPTVVDLNNFWYYPMGELMGAFGNLKPEENSPEKEFAGLSLTRQEALTDFWEQLGDMLRAGDFSGDAAEELDLAGLAAAIENFLENEGKEPEDRVFLSAEKERFAAQFRQEERLDLATERELALCRRFTEELCAEENCNALDLKAYACYSGNRLYEKDWMASRDCLEKLYSLTDDPAYANTLGYIYYYGRCNNGVPEYDKAFPLFVVAAANVNHEGLYKLGDMFLHGYGCKKSPSTAKTLYRQAFEETKLAFLRGDVSGSFPDAALRMGNVHRDGIGVEKSIDVAYFFYLQASLASKMRMESSRFFGDSSADRSIAGALEEAKELLPEDFFEEFGCFQWPWEIQSLTAGPYTVRVEAKKQSDGSVILRGERVSLFPGVSPEPVLVTMPQLDFCEIVSSVEYEAENAELNFTAILADVVSWNCEDSTVEFYFNGELAGWIRAEAYYFYHPQRKVPTGKKYRLVSVAFQPGGKTYDYLCDSPDVQVGDSVLVSGSNGDTQCLVIRVFSAYESELSLPLEKYKYARPVFRRSEAPRPKQQLN